MDRCSTLDSREPFRCGWFLTLITLHEIPRSRLAERTISSLVSKKIFSFPHCRNRKRCTSLFHAFSYKLAPSRPTSLRNERLSKVLVRVSIWQNDHEHTCSTLTRPRLRICHPRSRLSTRASMVFVRRIGERDDKRARKTLTGSARTSHGAERVDRNDRRSSDKSRILGEFLKRFLCSASAATVPRTCSAILDDFRRRSSIPYTAVSLEFLTHPSPYYTQVLSFASFINCRWTNLFLDYVPTIAYTHCYEHQLTMNVIASFPSLPRSRCVRCTRSKPRIFFFFSTVALVTSPVPGITSNNSAFFRGFHPSFPSRAFLAITRRRKFHFFYHFPPDSFELSFRFEHGPDEQRFLYKRKPNER